MKTYQKIIVWLGILFVIPIVASILTEEGTMKGYYLGLSISLMVSMVWRDLVA